MTASESVNPAGLLREQLESASPDMLRAMVKTFAEALMCAEADAACGAGYGERSPERVNSRNGYRPREWDTRAGTVELAIPKLRSGSYFPDWLLQHRRRAEQALVSVVATSYLLGVSTRRVEKLVEQLGVKQLSKSQVSEMAQHLDVQVEAFRSRPLDSSHYTFVWMDALVIKVREHGRTVNVHALVAVGVNADGGREVLGLDVCSDEDGAGWLAFLRSLTARGLSGVRLVISDAHRGLVAAIGAALPGAAWQRCRTHWSCREISRGGAQHPSLVLYGDRCGDPAAGHHTFRGPGAASERTAEASGARGRGPAPRPRRGASGRPGGRCERDDRAGRRVRTGKRRRSPASRPRSPARRRPQATDRA
jgi:transposase-like protein